MNTSPAVKNTAPPSKGDSLEEVREQDVTRKGYADAEIREINKKDRTITAYVSTIVKDSFQEVVLPVFDFSRFQKNPVVLWVHDIFFPPIGRSLWQKTDDRGLITKTEFQNKTQFGIDIWNLYADGFLKAWSIGYQPRKRVRPGDDEWQALWEEWQFDASAREIHTDNFLFEYSAVPVPANPEAVNDMMAVVKSASMRLQIEGALRQRVHEEALVTVDNSEVLAELQKINVRLDALETDDGERRQMYQEILALETALKHRQKAEKPEPVPEKAIDFDQVLKAVPEIVDGAFRRIKGQVS